MRIFVSVANWIDNFIPLDVSLLGVATVASALSMLSVENKNSTNLLLASSTFLHLLILPFDSPNQLIFMIIHSPFASALSSKPSDWMLCTLNEPRLIMIPMSNFHLGD